MAQFLGPAVFQLSSASAVPYVGGKLHVYETGTSTPLSLFSDEDLQTPTANPLVADAAGVFPIAFLAETQCKIIITDSADQTLYTRDPVITIGFADNVPASGVSYDGSTSGLASNDVQDAIDEVVDLMSLTQDWSTTSDGVIATGTSTNAGANAGPVLDLYRNSASPANSDAIGGVILSGKNASGVKVDYAKVAAVITDTTNGSEDAEIWLTHKYNGANNSNVVVKTGDLLIGGDSVQQGIAKAWVNFNGTGTVAIRDSYNVSSITDNGTGDYTINFTNVMANSDYVPALAVATANTNTSSFNANVDETNTPTTSALRIQTRSSGTPGKTDFAYVMAAVFGD